MGCCVPPAGPLAKLRNVAAVAHRIKRESLTPQIHQSKRMTGQARERAGGQGLIKVREEERKGGERKRNMKCICWVVVIIITDTIKKPFRHDLE